MGNNKSLITKNNSNLPDARQRHILGWYLSYYPESLIKYLYYLTFNDSLRTREIEPTINWIRRNAYESDQFIDFISRIENGAFLNNPSEIKKETDKTVKADTVAQVFSEDIRLKQIYKDKKDKKESKIITGSYYKRALIIEFYRQEIGLPPYQIEDYNNKIVDLMYINFSNAMEKDDNVFVSKEEKNKLK